MYIYSYTDVWMAFAEAAGPGVPKATTTDLGVDAIWPDDADVPTGLTLTSTVAGDPRLGDPTGTVEFKDGASSLGTATLIGNGNGTATATLTWTAAAPGLSFGDHPITAVYSGDANHTKSASDVNPVSLQADNGSDTTASDWGYGEGGDGTGGGDNNGIEFVAVPPGPAPASPTSSTLSWNDFPKVAPGTKPYAAFTAGRIVATENHEIDTLVVKVAGGWKVDARAKLTNPTQFSAVFDGAKSYVVRGQESDYLLNHEKLHLQIAEYVAAKANANLDVVTGRGMSTNGNEVAAINAAQGAAMTALRTMFNQYRIKVATINNVMQVRYDGETSHSINYDAQGVWDANYASYIDDYCATQGWTR